MRSRRRHIAQQGAQQRGFTLIEVVVASVMAGILTTAGLSAFVMFNQQRVRLERSLTADDTGKVVLQYLVRELQRVGGSVLRPWQAIAVEQDPCGKPGDPFGSKCVAGDRITFAFIDEAAGFTSCEIKSLTDTSISFGLPLVHNGHTACCPLHRNSGAPISSTALKDKHIMLQSTGNSGVSEEQYRAVTFTSGNTGNCTFNIITSAQVRPLSSRCTSTDTSLCQDNRPGIAVFDGFINNGTAIPITVATAYIGCLKAPCNSGTDIENRALFLFSDRNAGASANLTITVTDDNFAISPNIADLQVALGYDLDDNGEITESADGVGDEYLGNVFLDSDLKADFVEAFTNDDIPSRRLRMIHIGVMAAIKVNDRSYKSAAQLPGAPGLLATSLQLRALTSKAAFRSLNQLE